MVVKNAILLIIKQNPGIDYNSLLSKISANYKSANSARAALSRSLKDLKIFGYINVLDNNRFYVTEKASALINTEMKNKLLLKLNELMGGRDSYLRASQIVQYLQTLIERAKQDSDLLKVARGSTDFHIAEIAEIRENVAKHAVHLNYIATVLEQQIASLQQLDFDDMVKKSFDAAAKKEIVGIAQSLNEEEFYIEPNRNDALDEISIAFDKKPKGTAIFLPKSEVEKLLNVVEKMCAKDNALVFTIYISPFKIKIQGNVVYFTAPYSKLASLQQA